jgi:RNA polymerase sigma-70 factor (ECF subfamily)
VLNVLERHDGEAVSEVGQVPPVLAEQDIHAALAEGDTRRALQLCAREYGPAIGRLCMALLGSQTEAEDLAQETLVAAYQSFDAYRRDGSLRAWLFGIARKKCLKSIETRRRRTAKLVLIEGGEAAPSAEDLLERRQIAERARAALEEVRPTEREALVLRFQCELPYHGVALACAIDETAARKRVSRGLLRLREVLMGAKQQTEES